MLEREEITRQVGRFEGKDRLPSPARIECAEKVGPPVAESDGLAAGLPDESFLLERKGDVGRPALVAALGEEDFRTAVPVEVGRGRSDRLEDPEGARQVRGNVVKLFALEFVDADIRRFNSVPQHGVPVTAGGARRGR